MGGSGQRLHFVGKKLIFVGKKKCIIKIWVQNLGVEIGTRNSEIYWFRFNFRNDIICNFESEEVASLCK